MIETLNNRILKIADAYPSDGTFPYLWPRKKDIEENPSLKYFAGVTQELTYKGEVVATPHGKNTYCCGITFEWWWFAALGAEMNLSGTDFKRLRLDWFVATPGKVRGVVDALVDRGWGILIPNLNQALPGDLIQFFRKNGSGHSVVFKAKTQEGIFYRSTQLSTNGIGDTEEPLNKMKSVHIVRAINTKTL